MIASRATVMVVPEVHHLYWVEHLASAGSPQNAYREAVRMPIDRIRPISASGDRDRLTVFSAAWKA